MNKRQQGIVWTPLLIIVSVIAVAGIATYMLIQSNNSDQNQNSNTATNKLVVNQTNSNKQANINEAANANSTAITDNWKTHIDSEHGYEFQYPDNWELGLARDTLNPIYGSSDADFATASYFTDDSGYPDVSVDMRAYTIDPAATLQEIAVLDEDLGTKDAGFVKTVTDTFTETEFAGFPALQYAINSTNNPDGSESYYIQETIFRKGATVFEIELIASTSEKFSDWENTFNAILSTFRFTK